MTSAPTTAPARERIGAAPTRYRCPSKFQTSLLATPSSALPTDGYFAFRSSSYIGVDVEIARHDVTIGADDGHEVGLAPRRLEAAVARRHGDERGLPLFVRALLVEDGAELFVARQLGGLVGQVDAAQKVERRPGGLRALDALLHFAARGVRESDVRTETSTAIVVRSTTTAAASGMRARYIREPLPGDGPKRVKTPCRARLSHRHKDVSNARSLPASTGHRRGRDRQFPPSYPQGRCGLFPPYPTGMRDSS